MDKISKLWRTCLFIFTFFLNLGTGYLFWGNFIESKKRSIFLDSDQQKTGKWQTIYKTSFPPDWKVKTLIRHLFCLHNEKQLEQFFVCMCVWLIKTAVLSQHSYFDYLLINVWPG